MTCDISIYVLSWLLKQVRVIKKINLIEQLTLDEIKTFVII